MSTVLPRLNLIGPGRLGQTLARLWQEAGCVEIAAIVGRDASRAEAAAGFIGGGTTTSLAAMPPAELTLLSTPDDQLSAAVAALAAQETLRPGDVVFHCSGALGSDMLVPLAQQGALTASIHPLKSFARPELAIGDFAGTCCAHEGNPAALARLLPLFEAIGGRCFAIAPEHKTLYHAGAVLACNTLVALMEASLRAMEAAGLPRDLAWPALRPLVEGTVHNIGTLGTAQALTGPVARGDADTVARQMTATANVDPLLGAIYRDLSQMALALAAPQLPAARREALEQALAMDAEAEKRYPSPPLRP